MLINHFINVKKYYLVQLFTYINGFLLVSFRFMSKDQCLCYQVTVEIIAYRKQYRDDVTA